MQDASFANRRIGVLVWGAAYLGGALAIGLGLAAAWPTGGDCATSCVARVEAGVHTLEALAVSGALGLVAAVGLGLARRTQAPRWLVLSALGLAVAAAGFALSADGPAGADGSGLAAARAAYAWPLAVPALSLVLSAAVCALAQRRVRPAALQAGLALAAAAGLVAAAMHAAA